MEETGLPSAWGSLSDRVDTALALGDPQSNGR